MKVKLLVLAAVVGGMFYFGVKPADILDKGGAMWEQFVGDFEALTNGEAVAKLSKPATERAAAAVQTSPGIDAAATTEGIADRLRGALSDSSKEAHEQAKAANRVAEEHMRQLEEQIKQAE